MRSSRRTFIFAFVGACVMMKFFLVLLLGLFFDFVMVSKVSKRNGFLELISDEYEQEFFIIRGRITKNCRKGWKINIAAVKA